MSNLDSLVILTLDFLLCKFFTWVISTTAFSVLVALVLENDHDVAEDVDEVDEQKHLQCKMYVYV
jgi:hypothetical protein